MIKITKKFTFDMSHRLTGYNGACANLHGHTYLLEVTVTKNELNNSGMVCDFNTLKTVWETKIKHRYDHVCMLEVADENLQLISCLKNLKCKVIETNYNPTVENMISRIAQDFNENLQELDVQCCKIKLYETPTSFATWNGGNTNV